MPARIQEVLEYIAGARRNRAYTVWREQRRQDELRAARAAAFGGSGGFGPERFAEDWSESSGDLAEDRYDYQEVLARLAVPAGSPL
eukprot:7276886-Alexandrium_andersonii.AAC.1